MESEESIGILHHFRCPTRIPPLPSALQADEGGDTYDDTLEGDKKITGEAIVISREERLTSTANVKGKVAAAALEEDSGNEEGLDPDMMIHNRELADVVFAGLRGPVKTSTTMQMLTSAISTEWLPQFKESVDILHASNFARTTLDRGGRWPYEMSLLIDLESTGTLTCYTTRYTVSYMSIFFLFCWCCVVQLVPSPLLR